MRWNCRRRRRCQAPLTVGIALLVSLVTATAASAQADRAVTRLGEGVYFIRHRGEGGNTTIVIGARDVLVVDASGGAATQYDIQQIRALTDKPVRYLLNTHWHGDHNFGNAHYMRAFPGIDRRPSCNEVRDGSALHRAQGAPSPRDGQAEA
jgi:glyoxylase-like metal-dependent hydrolase (beta-lactamase superfamily II)